MRAATTVSGLLVLGCLACGGGDTKQSEVPKDTQVSQSSFDACALLTFDEINSAVGWTPDSSVKKSYGTTGNCTYFGPNAYTQTVSLLVGQGMPEMSDARKMAEWRAKQYTESKVSGAIVEPVEDLGVPAIRNEFGVVAIEMAVGDKLYTVTGLTAKFDQVRKLAGFVLARAK